MKRFLRILLILFVVLVAVFLIYIFFFGGREDLGLPGGRLPRLTPGGDDPTIPTPTPIPGETGPTTEFVEPTETTRTIRRPRFFLVSNLDIVNYGVFVRTEKKLIPTQEVVRTEQPDGTFANEVVDAEKIIEQSIPTLRYNDSIDGFIYQAEVNDEGVRAKRITEDRVPFPRESFFTASGSHAFMRFFNQGTESIQTFGGSVRSSVEEATCPYTFPTSMKPGDRSRSVETMQEVLAQSFRTQDETFEVGLYDETTTAWVKKLQTQAALTADGQAGPKTRRALETLCLKQAEEEAIGNQLFSNDAEFIFDGSFLPENILQADVSPSEDKAFYLAPSRDTFVGTIVDLKSGLERRVFENPFSEWLVDWNANDTIFFTTKASKDVPGYLFALDTETEDFLRLLGNRNGLTTNVSPNGQSILYSQTDGAKFSTGVYGAESGIDKALGVITLPEKCDWSNDNIHVYCAVPKQIDAAEYPDDWYQGFESFNDTIWRINTQTGVSDQLVDPQQETGVGMDMIHLEVDELNQFVFMINKNTGNLWGLEIETR